MDMKIKMMLPTAAAATRGIRLCPKDEIQAHSASDSDLSSGSPSPKVGHHASTFSFPILFPHRPRLGSSAVQLATSGFGSHTEDNSTRVHTTQLISHQTLTQHSEGSFMNGIQQSSSTHKYLRYTRKVPRDITCPHDNGLIVQLCLGLSWRRHSAHSSGNKTRGRKTP